MVKMGGEKGQRGGGEREGGRERDKRDKRGVVKRNWRAPFPSVNNRKRERSSEHPPVQSFCADLESV